MKCPSCGAVGVVLETRLRVDGSKRRRYECANEHRYSTEERITQKPEPKKAPPKKSFFSWPPRRAAETND